MAAGCIDPPASGKGRSFSKDLSQPGLTGLVGMSEVWVLSVSSVDLLTFD